MGKNNGFFSQLKNQIMTGVGVILTGLGTLFLDEVKSFLGLSEDEPAATTEMKQEVNVQGPEIIINIPEQKPVKEKVIVKEVPVEKKKEEEQEIIW